MGLFFQLGIQTAANPNHISLYTNFNNTRIWHINIASEARSIYQLDLAIRTLQIGTRYLDRVRQQVINGNFRMARRTVVRYARRLIQVERAFARDPAQQNIQHLHSLCVFYVSNCNVEFAGSNHWPPATATSIANSFFRLANDCDRLEEFLQSDSITCEDLMREVFKLLACFDSVYAGCNQILEVIKIRATTASALGNALHQCCNYHNLHALTERFKNRYL